MQSAAAIAGRHVLMCCTAKFCRSLFMWYMWRIADVDTEVLE